jgi:soluble lytic murein transglycosylase-like protein
MARWSREREFDGLIAAAAARYGVPAAIVQAVIGAESGFSPTARRAEPPKSSLPPTPDHPDGGDESLGLMQLLVRTARALGFQGPKSQLYDPATNIDLGVKLLRAERDRVKAHSEGLGYYSDPLAANFWLHAASAYNGGPRYLYGYGWPRADGTFANQAYVNTVADNAQYFVAFPPIVSTLPPGQTISTAGGSMALFLLFAAVALLSRR